MINAFVRLGFMVVRVGNHVSLARDDASHVRISVTLPNHRRIKASTLQTACRLADIDRYEFLEAFRNS